MLSRLRPRADEAHEEGFSLVELLVVMILLGIFGGIVSGELNSALRISRVEQARVTAQVGLQVALERMNRTIRAADPITTATASSLAIQVTQAGVCRTITYAVSSAAQVASTAHTGYAVTETSVPCAGGTSTVHILVPAVASTAAPFTYAQQDGTSVGAPVPSSSLSSIARVTITLSAAVPENHASVPASTVVDIRNNLP